MTEQPAHCGPSTDSGLTLTELLVVVTLLGLLTITIAGIFTVILRTSPTTEARIDDSRSLLGLTTWIPQDVSSAEIDGFDQTPYADGVPASVDGDGSISEECTAGSVPSSPAAEEILKLRWTEGGSTFLVDYRFLLGPSGADGVIMRYACRAGGAPNSAKMTSSLTLINGAFSGTPPSLAPVPVDLQMLATTGGNIGVEFNVVVVDADSNAIRELLSLDATTVNLQGTLPPLGTTTPPPPNAQPSAPTFAFEVTENVSTPIPTGATDPDVTDTLTLTVDDVTPVCACFVVSGVTLDGFTAPIGSAGSSYQITYTVDDGAGLPNSTAIGVITVSVVASTSTSAPTTAAPPPCVVTGINVAPNSAENRGPGNAPTNVGPLRDDVRVDIQTTGTCSGLVLAFDPDHTDANVVQETENFGAGTQVLIRKNAYDWRDRSAPGHPLQVRAGANGTVLATGNLVIL